jgi:hypothetical protein
MFVSSAAGIVAAQLFWAVLSFAAHGIRSAIAPRARVRTEADFEDALRRWLSMKDRS